MSATCAACGTTLSGNWSMESNPSNSGYSTSSTGRYLGISDGYFLYSGNPNWVYSYCRNCWIQQIKSILPSLGITEQIIANPTPAKCSTCSKALNGHWKMETNPQNQAHKDEPTGRYLGISDGYFLYGQSPNWVYCYCKECWLKQIQALNIDKEKIDALNIQISELKQKLKNSEEELISEKAKIDGFNIQISELNKTIKKYEEELNCNEIEKINLKKIYTDASFETLNDLLNPFSNEDKEQYKEFINKDIIYQNLLTEFKKVAVGFFKELTQNFLCKLNDQFESLTKKQVACASEIENYKNSLKNAGFPEETMKNSLLPLEKYLNDVKSYVEILKNAKEKTEILKRGE